jgi:hypothetical protein
VWEHAECLGADGEKGGVRWAALVPLPDKLQDEILESVRMLSSIEAHEIQAYAEQNLRPRQLAALRRWLLGHDVEEIVERLGDGDGETNRDLVRAAIAKLRYRFAGPGRSRSRKSTGDPESF